MTRALYQSDGIEVVNGTLTKRANRRAWRLCWMLDKIPLGGSDSHQVETIGTVMVALHHVRFEGSMFEAMQEDRVLGIYGPESRPRLMANTGPSSNAIPNA